jgi:DNA-directed RNA polymerase subunit RPC12/RpoP
MSVVLVQLPKTEIVPNGRPKKCPYCGSQILQRWGRVTKPIKDKTDKLVLIYRYRCNDCEKTFRDYPDGVNRSDHARGIRQLAALLSALGLSSRHITEIFGEYGITLSHTTIWRDGKELEERLGGKKIYYFQRFRIDKEDVFQLYSKLGVVIALDFGGDDFMVLGVLNEHSPSKVISWLRPLIQGTEIRTVRLDTGPFVYNQLAYA